MENAEYRNIFENEDTNFYYIATHAFVLALVKRVIATNKVVRLLDAGAGTGMLAKKLSALGRVAAVDISPRAVSFARKRGVRVRQASLADLPYPTNTFDVVTCVDVLHHRRINDGKALGELHRVLKPGGVLVLRVPALPWLRLSHDDVVHTRHRYTKDELRMRLRTAGFIVDKLTYVGLVLLPFRIVRKLYELLLPPHTAQSLLTPLPVPINRCATWLMHLDHWIAVGVGLPIGIGLVAVAKKRRYQNIPERK